MRPIIVNSSYVDVGCNRQARAQIGQGALPGIQTNANTDTLDDFGEIAGTRLGQQSEFAARAGRIYGSSGRAC